MNWEIVKIFKVSFVLVKGCGKDNEVILTNLDVVFNFIFVVELIIGNEFNALVQTFHVVIDVGICLLVQYEKDLGRRHLVDFEILESPTADA